MCYYFHVLSMVILILIHQYLVLVFLEFLLINLVNHMLLFSYFECDIFWYWSINI